MPRPQWEFAISTLPVDDRLAVVGLDLMGEEGWQLVSVIRMVGSVPADVPLERAFWQRRVIEERLGPRPPPPMPGTQ